MTQGPFVDLRKERRKECQVPCQMVQETHDAVLETRGVIGALVGRVKVLEDDIYNGGKDGLKTQMTALVATLSTEKELQKTNDDEREKRQERRDRRMNFILGVFSAVMLFLTMLLLVPDVIPKIKALLYSDLHWPKLFAMTNPEHATNQPQTAGELNSVTRIHQEGK